MATKPLQKLRVLQRPTEVHFLFRCSLEPDTYLDMADACNEQEALKLAVTWLRGFTWSRIILTAEYDVMVKAGDRA